MALKPELPVVDLAALLEVVNPRGDEERRQEQMDDMLQRLEDTHRQASASLRQFEQRGRPAKSDAAAAAMAAMAALAAAQSDAAARSAPSQRPRGRPAHEAVTKATTEAVAGELNNDHKGGEDDDHLPQRLSDEVTAAQGFSVPIRDASEVTSVRMPSPQEHGAPSPPEKWSVRDTQAESPDRTAAPRVYAGRGKDLPAREGTRTEVVKRPKK